MNKLCLSVFLLGMVVVVLGAPKTFQENLRVLKNIDLDTVLKNDRIMKNYIDCVLGEKSCTKEGAALKESWKDGLDRGCDVDCTPDEQIKVKKIIKHIYVNHKDWYDLLADKLDADKKYRTKYDDYIQEILKDKSL